VLTKDTVDAHFGARVQVTPGQDGRPVMMLVRP
jgi:hypothetical protein